MASEYLENCIVRSMVVSLVVLRMFMMVVLSFYDVRAVNDQLQKYNSNSPSR